VALADQLPLTEAVQAAACAVFGSAAKQLKKNKTETNIKKVFRG
jgi:hypothetical protein